MKYEQKFKDFVMKWLTEYRDDVFGGEYRMTTDFEEENHKEDTDDIARNADTEIKLDYLTIHITIYPNLFRIWKSKDYDKVKDTLLHEMCHLLTEPLFVQSWYLLDGILITKQELNEVKERQTQRIKNSIMRLNDCIDEKDREIKKLKNHSGRSGKSH